MTENELSPYQLYKNSLDFLHSGHLKQGFRLYENRYHRSEERRVGKECRL